MDQGEHQPDRLRPRSGRVACVLIALVLGGLVCVQARAVRLATCETYDESVYLKVALRVLRYADFQGMAGPMSPPLPLVLGYWLPAIQARYEPKTDGWDRAVPGLIAQARLLAAVTFGVPLVLLVFGWITRRRGWLAGALAGLLVAFSPTVLASASIATTDACFALFGVLALAAIHRYQTRPTTNSFLAMGGAIGLALASKQSAVILFPVAAGELWLNRPNWDVGSPLVARTARSSWWVASRLVGLVAVAFLADWALCGFGVARFGVRGTSCVAPAWLSTGLNWCFDPEVTASIVSHLGMPLAVDTFVGQMKHARVGHGAYLLGQTSFLGWWYFFPVALAVKSTPSELALVALVGGLAWRRSTWLDPARRIWLLAAGWMLAAGMTSSVNIGQRYMILIYPLVILLGVDALGELAGRSARGLRPAALVAGLMLVVGQTLSAVGIAPHYLAYFNGLCGGPMAGHRYLLDSSLDWGQDLPTLRRELEARHYQKVALNYFGTAHPAIYGLRAADWTGPAEAVAGCDWLAISATALHEVYGGPPAVHDRFKDLPSTRAGYTIFLYDLSDPRVREAWDAVRGHEPSMIASSKRSK